MEKLSHMLIFNYVFFFSEKGFHPHPSEPPLFEEGQHVKLDPAGSAKLVDFR